MRALMVLNLIRRLDSFLSVFCYTFVFKLQFCGLDTISGCKQVQDSVGCDEGINTVLA